MIKFTCLKETSEDWYPNIDGKYVAVSYYSNPETEPLVCVWGNDDCGMEYIGNDAQYIFHRLLEEGNITRKICENLGLRSC